jgi:hypothetical protein
MYWEKFPDELDPSALQTTLDAFRGKPIDRDRAVLAGFNVAGFAYGKGFAKPLAGSSAAFTADDVDAAFAAAQTSLAPAEGGLAAAAGNAGAVPWALIVEIALRVLSRFIK